MNGSPTVLVQVVAAAAEKNKWRIIASMESAPASGLLQHGVALVERNGKTLYDASTRFATTVWYRREDGVVGFERGHYDMTFDEAVKSFNERATQLARFDS